MATKKPEYYLRKCAVCKGMGCSKCNGTGLIRIPVEDVPIQVKKVQPPVTPAVAKPAVTKK